jgi:hypothetical protein
VAAYFFAAGMCLRASKRDWAPEGLWRAMALGLILLGINIELNIQSLITTVGRELARDEHWYDDRRGVQRVFILIVAGCATVAAIAALQRVRRQSLGIKGASLGFVLLCAFIIIRMTSLHNVDSFLRSMVLILPWNRVIELGCLGVIAFSAAVARERRARPR